MIMTGLTSLGALLLLGWGQNWRMSFKLDKTVGMFFNRTQAVPVNNIIFCDTQITFVKEDQHLGFRITWITSDLKFNRHIDEICRTIASSFFASTSILLS